MARKTTGLRKRHARTCRSSSGGRCNCSPTWQASAWDPQEHKRVWRSFPTEAAAKSWRHDAAKLIELGKLKAGEVPRVREAADAWLEGAKAGSIFRRDGERFRPSTLRGYEHALRDRLLPEFGDLRLNDLRRPRLQAYVRRLIGEGWDASTIRNALMPLRAVYREAIDDGIVAVSPLAGLKLPKVRGKRDRVASVVEAEALIAALPESDRVLWSVAFFCGLRLGELRALKWECIDLAAGRLEVRHSWDPQAGEIEPKSEAGRRMVPIPGLLRERLIAHRLRTGGVGHVFPRDDDTELPFTPHTISRRAKRTWERAGMTPITLHEARHTAASYLIASGVNLKAVSVFLGHANINITADRYGHLLPGSEAEAAELLDAYFAGQLERAEDAARAGEDSAPDVADRIEA